MELFLAPDRSAELDMYKDGQTDAFGLAALPSKGLYRARQQHAGEYVRTPHLAVGYMAFDVHRPPFDDPRVRRAFVLAIDRETLADVVLRGHDSPATGGFILP